MGSDRRKELTFAALIEAAEPELLRYLMSILPQADDAAEVLQETRIALWNRFDDYRSDEPFLPWAYRFAYHHVLKHRARIGRRVKLLSADVLERLAERRLDRADLLEARRAALADCLASLPERDQQLLEHRYARRITMQQLAAESGRNIHTLYKSLERLRAGLMDCINRRIAAGEVAE